MADEHRIVLQPGTVIGGKYEVVKCLGSGSMGLVYACRNRDLQGHMVAVKVLFPEVAQDKVAAARFRNEIFASYNVSHPNVVRAYEYLRDGDLVAYTMEYVGGGDLAERLSRAGEKVAIPEAMRLLSQMCAGVQAIHDAGIVHRDLKPENILLSKEGNVKIADFGIARNRHGPKLTEHGGVVGTIDYVSPEYMLNSQVDWRSDIYAIGILAYEMVCGEAPFRGDSVYATMTKRLKTDPNPPSAVRSDCPKGLDTIILRAMHRDPQERYQSAMEIFFDLQKLATEQKWTTAVTGGVFLPNQPGGRGYVGPSMEEHSDDQRPATMEERAGTSIESWDNDSRPAPLPKQAERSFAAAGGVTIGGGPGLERSDTTEVLSPEIVSLAAQYGEMVDAPQKLEKVLAHNDLMSDSWREAQARDGITLQAGSLSTRVRDLSTKYYEQQTRQQNFKELVVMIVAMIVGIGIGLTVIYLFFPGLLGSMMPDILGKS